MRLKPVRMTFAALMLVGVGQMPDADANPYPMCSPTVDPDCYFLAVIRNDFPEVTNSDADLIAGAKDACNWMRRDNSPAALGRWIEAHGREHPEYNEPGEQFSRFATLFAMHAATAYCPKMLNENNPDQW